MQLMMYLSGKCDNKREGKRTARQPPSQYHAPQTRPHVAFESLLHHRCAAKHPLRCRFHSSEEHQPYSARCLQIRRDGRARRRACSAVALKAVEYWEPLCLK